MINNIVASNVFTGEIVFCAAVSLVYIMKEVVLVVKEEIESSFNINEFIFFLLTVGLQLGIGIIIIFAFSFFYRFVMKDFDWIYAVFGIVPVITFINIFINDICVLEED